jgi:hypothetical protein
MLSTYCQEASQLMEDLLLFVVIVVMFYVTLFFLSHRHSKPL